MSRKPVTAEQASIDHLKQTVIKKTGLACEHFHDIQLLQHLVKRETSEYLSIQTLNRFFGLIKNGFKPSEATLNILSRFIGYHTFGEFEMVFHSLPRTVDKSIPLATLLAILFSDMEFQTMEESGLLSMTRNVCKMIELDPSMTEDVYPFMAACKYGRRYFFEHFINLDALNTHYGEGLHYYLMHAKHRDQQFFGITLLCKRYFLTGEYDLFERYYLKVQDFSFTEIKTFHSFLIGAYYAVRLYNSKIHNEPFFPIDDALFQISHVSTNEGAYGAFPWAEYLVGESLILVEEFYQAYKVLEAGSFWLKQMPSGLDKGFETQYQLLLLYARFFAGILCEKKAAEQLKNISEGPLFFLSRNYFSFFILHLTKMLSSKTEAKNILEQIDNIVEKTSFKHFQKLVAKPAPAHVRINGY